MTVMGDALVDGLSDAGSTPARSIACGKEGPTKWEDALSQSRRPRTKFV